MGAPACTIAVCKLFCTASCMCGIWDACCIGLMGIVSLVGPTVQPISSKPAARTVPFELLHPVLPALAVLDAHQAPACAAHFASILHAMRAHVGQRQRGAINTVAGTDKQPACSWDCIIVALWLHLQQVGGQGHAAAAIMQGNLVCVGWHRPCITHVRRNAIVHPGNDMQHAGKHPARAGGGAQPPPAKWHARHNTCMHVLRACK